MTLSPHNYKDMKGKKVGRWTVLEKAGTSNINTVNWLCRCDCGTERVVRGDALADRPEWGQFDLVVGNPPWGVKLNAGEAVKLVARAPAALSGHRDSYLFFLHLAAECVRDDGGIGMLLPDTVLSQVRYEGMRRALLERFRPEPPRRPARCAWSGRESRPGNSRLRTCGG